MVKLAKFTKWAFGVCAVLAVVIIAVVTGPMDRGGVENPVQAPDPSPQNRSSEDSALLSKPPQSEIPADSSMALNRFAGGAQPGWTVVNQGAVEAERLPPRQDTYTDARLVSLAGDWGSWGPGARVIFDIPHTGRSIESVIERVESGLAGNISYIGRVDRDDILQRIIVTVGARNAFAFIASDQGSFEMVGNREFGWLMSTAGMEQHVDYSKPDYYIPGYSLPDGS